MGEAVIPSDWQGEYCCYSVQWPNSPEWKAVLRGILVIASRGRHWEESTGSILEAQSVIKATFDYNLQLKEVLVTCGDESLSEIAAAIRLLAQSQCCGDSPIGTKGSAGAPEIEPELGDITQGDDEIDEPPIGFETWDEFYNDKCNVAADILNKLQYDLSNLMIINFAVMTTDGLAVALTVILTLAVPPAAIVGLATLLLIAGGTVIVASLLSLINDNEEELRCALYAGNSPTESYNLFHTAVSDLASVGILDAIDRFGVVQVAKYFVNHFEVNRLYQKDLTKVYGPMDCSSCIEEICPDCIKRHLSTEYIADLVVPSAGWFEMVSSSAGPYHTLQVRFVGPDSYRFRFRNISGWTQYVGVNNFWIRDSSGAVVHSSNSFAAFAAIAEDYCHEAGGWSQIEILSSSFFTWESKTERC